jgi:hypothetical protein
LLYDVEKKNSIKYNKMTSTPNKGAKAKGKSSQKKSSYELFQQPDVENLPAPLDENLVFNAALANNYQMIFGSFDLEKNQKDIHPMAEFIIENDLFNKRNKHGKTPLDMASFIGNKEFLKALFDRIPDKINDSILNLRLQIKPSVAYNFLHYAVIWNRIELCKFLIRSQMPIIDPSIEGPIETSGKASTTSNLLITKTLGSYLIKTKSSSTGETPKQLAQRYKHNELIDYFTFAEKRQDLVDRIAEVKSYVTDTEKNMNKLPKDDKVNKKKFIINQVHLNTSA